MTEEAILDLIEVLEEMVLVDSGYPTFTKKILYDKLESIKTTIESEGNNE